MNKSGGKSINILRILIAIMAVLYLIFLIFEGVQLINGSSFADISVYLLFLIFVLGVYFMWKDEFISGIILIAWYLLQWILVFWVWEDGGLTLILGFPIAVIGLVVLIHGIRKRKSSKIN